MPSAEQIDTLHALNTLFSENSQILVIVTLVAMVIGAIFLALVAWDWNKRRRGNLFPILLAVIGGVTLLSSFILYSAFGNLAALEYDVPLTVWRETAFAAEFATVKQMAAETSGWAVIGLTAGFLYLMLAGAALAKNWFLKRRQGRGGAMPAPANIR